MEILTCLPQNTVLGSTWHFVRSCYLLAVGIVQKGQDHQQLQGISEWSRPAVVRSQPWFESAHVTLITLGLPRGHARSTVELKGIYKDPFVSSTNSSPYLIWTFLTPSTHPNLQTPPLTHPLPLAQPCSLFSLTSPFSEEKCTLFSLALHPLISTFCIRAWAGETETDTEWARPEIPKERRRGNVTESHTFKIWSLLFLQGTFPLLIWPFNRYLCQARLLAQGHGNGNTSPLLLGAHLQIPLSQPLPRTRDAPDHPGSRPGAGAQPARKLSYSAEHRLPSWWLFPASP